MNFQLLDEQRQFKADFVGVVSDFAGAGVRLLYRIPPSFPYRDSAIFFLISSLSLGGPEPYHAVGADGTVFGATFFLGIFGDGQRALSAESLGR